MPPPLTEEQQRNRFIAFLANAAFGDVADQPFNDPATGPADHQRWLGRLYNLLTTDDALEDAGIDPGSRVGVRIHRLLAHSRGEDQDLFVQVMKAIHDPKPAAPGGAVTLADPIKY